MDWLQRVKELHPDLNATYTAADGEAFLQLVTAYDVLSDPEQRQLYDITTSSQLPRALRRAAAAAATTNSSADAGDHQTGELDSATALTHSWYAFSVC